MSKHSSTIRYYCLVGVYGISIGFLLMSAFVGIEYLNPERRWPTNQYPPWIFGFGTVGLVLLVWAMIADVRWSQSGLIVRPDVTFGQHTLLVISIGNGIFLVPSLLVGILTVGFSVGSLGQCALVPLTIILWLISALRFTLGFRNLAKKAAAPLLLNSIVLCLVVLLYWTNNQTEFGFRWRLGGYEEVVQLVERGELEPNDSGHATLPEEYQWLSDSGEVIIIQREDLTSVIFFTQIEFPGEYYAIAYRSDDSAPENYYDDRCDRGWRVQADIPKWFTCISTRIE